MGGPPEPAASPNARFPTRMCVGCGHILPWDADVCPHCGRDYRYEPQQTGKSARVGTGMRILVYLLSFFIPFLGIIIGVVFYASSNEEDYKHVGKICLLISLLPLLLLLVCWFFGSMSTGIWLPSLSL